MNQRFLRNALISLAACTVMVQAQDLSSACKERKDKLLKQKDVCVALKDKDQAQFAKCKKDYDKSKVDFQQACENGNANAGNQVQVLEEYINKNNCTVRPSDKSTAARCAVTMYQAANNAYQAEQQEFLLAQDKFEADYKKWVDRDKKGPEPKEAKRKFDKSLLYYTKLIEQYPEDRAMPNALMNTSLIYEAMLQDDKAFELRTRLVKQFPSHTTAPQAWLRIGEYHYNNRKYRDAIEAYKQVTGIEGLQGKIGALAIYHLAESYNNVGSYQEAAEKFYEYIIGADSKKYPADLRAEALPYLASAFADMDEEGIDQAIKFMKGKDVSFKDTLFFEIGMKNKERDKLKEALYSFKRLLEYNPNHYKAPEASVQIIRIMEEKQQKKEAYDERVRVVKEYADGSDWFSKNANNKEAVNAARALIRSAYLEIPAFHHREAEKLDKTGDIEAAKKEYAKAVDKYREFLGVYNAPSWDQYQVHGILATLYFAQLKDYKNAATEYDWLDGQDTAKYGAKTKGYANTLAQSEAAYNAVVALDKRRDENRKALGNDAKKAYNTPETQEYLAQVDKYIAKYGKDPANKEAPELAYNAALIHYEAENYTTAITVLSQVKKTYPDHKYIKEMRGQLAKSLTQAGRLEDAEKEYQEILDKKYYATTDTNYIAIERSIAAVQFQRAEQLVKAGQNEQGANLYVAMQKRFPKLVFSDKALFEAGVAYEAAGKMEMAEKAWMKLPNEYPQSDLAIKGVVRSAKGYEKARNFKKAAEIYMVAVDKFKADSIGTQMLATAAAMYDSLGDKLTAAKTFESAKTRYPNGLRTPELVYSGCLEYEDIKNVKEAIRCNTVVVTDYAKSDYAFDAAYSIPVAYEKGKQTQEAIKAYDNFTKNFAKDKAKVVMAHTAAGRLYKELKDDANAQAQFAQSVKVYDQYGIKMNIDPAPAAEAAFEIGQYKRLPLMNGKIAGDKKAKEKKFKEFGNVVADAANFYGKSAAYKSPVWTFKSINTIGETFVNMAEKVRDQEIQTKGEEKFVEYIGIVQVLPTFYEKARSFFDKNVTLAREEGYYNPDVVTAETRLIEMWYRDGENFETLGKAFAESPVPKITDKEAEGEGFSNAKEWQEDYKMKLDEKAKAASNGGVPKYEACVKASEHYKIKNEWTNKCFDRIKALKPESEVLKLTWDKFDPKTSFSDPAYFQNKDRIAKIDSATDEAMSATEKANSYKAIAEKAKADKILLEKELKELKEKKADHEREEARQAKVAELNAAADAAAAAKKEAAANASAPSTANAPAPKKETAPKK